MNTQHLFSKSRDPVKFETWKASGGPYAGKMIRLESGSGGQTLIFTARGETGYYRYGVWIPRERV
jgi:hypothetical protein